MKPVSENLPEVYSCSSPRLVNQIKKEPYSGIFFFPDMTKDRTFEKPNSLYWKSSHLKIRYGEAKYYADHSAEDFLLSSIYSDFPSK